VTGYEFIFSNERRYRLTRHLSFWIFFCISRIFLNLNPGKPDDVFTLSSYNYALAYTIGYTPVSMFSIYIFIYVLVPRYLQKKKYLSFIIASLFTGAINFIACFFISFLIFTIFKTPLNGEESFYAPLRAGFRQGIVLNLSISLIVSGIKLAKGWYLQQVENTELAKLKSEKEIKLLRAQTQPLFLFQSLNTLREKIVCLDDEAPIMVLQLSELLSYLLYDSKDELISLQKELEMLELLIAIEKKNKRNNLETKIFIDGDKNNKYIIPLSLFANLQNAFLNNDQENMVNIRIHIEENFLHFNLSNHIDIDTEVSLYKLKQK
jgi:LytS/YehU family sensor histidine kinase